MPTGIGGTAGDAALRLGLGTHDVDGSIVFPGHDMGHSTLDAVQRIPESAAGLKPPSPVHVQAQPETASGTLPAGPAAPVSAGSSMIADSVAQAGAQADESFGSGEPGGPGDIDTLAVRLYPRISRQLRLELTRERDRLGALTDFRH